ncbi:unnamed protein product, partial [Staurois parvus]
MSSTVPIVRTDHPCPELSLLCTQTTLVMSCPCYTPRLPLLEPPHSVPGYAVSEL